MRRFGAIVATGSELPASDTRKENRTEDSDCVAEGKRMRTEAETKDTPAAETESNSSPSSDDGKEKVVSLGAPTEVQAVEPIFGTMSVTGRSREMEDAISTRTSLCSPDLNWRRPVHFFAVFDGHGGRHVSSLCKEKMHVIIEEELMRVRCASDGANAGGSTSTGEEPARETENAAEWEDRWRRAIRRCYQRMDEVAVSTCACGSDCARHSMEVALSGSTAVVALLTSKHIIVANCGDSRAVLCRAGRAIPLSFDHKPDRPDELARIEASGGRVIFVNGVRVEGILAMSRAIGDRYLKPFVTSEPDITFTKREAGDECLILASDGMWDVLSNNLACEVASECLREENHAADVDLDAGPRMVEDEGAEPLYPSRSVLAAALLTRLALGRRSSDNISVIVIDLKRNR